LPLLSLVLWVSSNAEMLSISERLVGFIQV
jgi:hypothetical protein